MRKETVEQAKKEDRVSPEDLVEQPISEEEAIDQAEMEYQLENSLKDMDSESISKAIASVKGPYGSKEIIKQLWQKING